MGFNLITAADKCNVHVVAALSPFRTETFRTFLPPGGTIADILTGLGLPKDIGARIFVEDRFVEPGAREMVRPPAGSLVTIRVIPGLETAIALAILAASTAATAAAPAAVGGLGVAATSGIALGSIGISYATLAGVIAGAGVGLIGHLITNALIPPPGPPKSNVSSAPAVFSISGPSNALAQYAPIPRVFAGAWWRMEGGRKVSPMLAAQSYTEALGDQQYLRMILTCGSGPLDMSGLKIASTLLTQFEDVQWEMRAGYPDDAPLTLYTNDVDEQDVSVLLLDTANHNTTPTGWQTLTSAVNADELSVDISCPEGLQTINDVGNHRRLTITLQVRYAPTGTTNWTYVGLTAPDGFFIRKAYTSPDPTTSFQMAGVTGSIVRQGLQWPVAQGQYDVSVQLTFITWLPNRNLNDTFFGLTNWTALRTIRHSDPINIKGLSKIALRIRASNQLNGPISNFAAVVGSYVRDWDPTAQSWESRAGSWDYDYDVANAGASAYALDIASPHTTGGRAIQITTAGSQDGAGVASRPIPTLGWSTTLINIAGWYKASSNVGQGCTLRVAFGADDNFQTGKWPDYAQGHPYSVGDTITPTIGNPGPFISGLGYIASGYTFRCVQAGTSTAAAAAIGWNQGIKGVTAVGGGCIFQNVGGPTLIQYDILANAAATTAWQQVTGSIKVPYNSVTVWDASVLYLPGEVVVYLDGNKYLCLIANQAEIPPDYGASWQPLPRDVIVGANFMRIVVYNEKAGTGVTVSWDDLLAQIQPLNINILPNPSFDYPGVVTANPASHFREVLEGSANQRPANDSQIDLGTLQTWHELAKANGYLFNGVMDKVSTVPETLRSIAAVGRASYFFRDGLYSVIMDQPQTAPVQHFSPRNSWGYLAKNPLIDLPQALRVRFVNAALDYRVDTIVVYDDGYNADGSGGMIAAQDFETLDESFGVVAFDPQPDIDNPIGLQPWKDARYHMAQGRLRMWTHQITAAWENIVCTRGDLIYLSHDVPRFGLGAGRVKAVFVDGRGNATGIITDEQFIGDGATQNAVRIRRSDGVSVLEPIGIVPATGAVGNRVNFTTPIPVASPQPEVGDLVLFGVLDTETQQMLVTAIEPSTDMTALLFLQSYAPAVYTAEQTTMPGFTSALAPTAIPAAPVIATTTTALGSAPSIRSDETVMVRHTDGSLN